MLGEILVSTYLVANRYISIFLINMYLLKLIPGESGQFNKICFYHSRTKGGTVVYTLMKLSYESLRLDYLEYCSGGYLIKFTSCKIILILI